MDVRLGSESQDSDEPVPPGITKPEFRDLKTKNKQQVIAKSYSPINTAPTAKGVEHAKKRLRAFSIQKKSPLTVPIAKPVTGGNTTATVVIGKLTGVKVPPKVDKPDDEPKKVKPPKPGSSKKILQESYTEVRKKTLCEIEDMKRKMELVELGIPLGLICPSTYEKAMPTKAMPPIKSFLDSAKVDELIREAKKAKEEGKDFKFDYRKLLPGYDNPFQRKKDESDTPDKSERKFPKDERHRVKDRRIEKEKYERRYDYKGRERDRYRDRDLADRSKGDSKERRKDRSVDNQEVKETDVNLNDYYVCDSWSLDTEDKNSNSSPKVDEKIQIADIPMPKEDRPKDTNDELKQSIVRKKDTDKVCKNISDEFQEVILKKRDSKLEFKREQIDSPQPKKVERLQPVMDSFKFEIDENDDEALDIFDEDIDLNKFSKKKLTNDVIKFDYERDISKDNEALNDDTFLESVINEIKQENMSDDESQDKGLVEYDISPVKEEELSKDTSRDSVTPELDFRFQNLSSRSDLSDGYKSTESSKSVQSYRSTESGYKSTESYKEDRRSQSRQSEEKEGPSLASSTMDSLETWSFILKICQPLLFRHDRDKCYKQTQSVPPVWWCGSPRRCSCVRGRGVVMAALDNDKGVLVAQLYHGDQLPDTPPLSSRGWYPPAKLSEPPVTSPTPPAPPAPREVGAGDEECLDREYQKFMEAVWPEVAEAKPETPPSSTPVKQESKKKKKEDDKEEKEEKKKAKKMKLSSDGWSQESDIEEEVEKMKKQKEKQKEPKEKSRKRKLSASTLSSDSDSGKAKKKKKNAKKKENKKAKSKAKRKKINKKILKKLKVKKKKKKQDTESELEEEVKETKKKDKKTKKIKQKQAKKKTEKKKKKAKSSSSSSSSDSSSDSESDVKVKKKKEESKKKKKDKKKKRKQSTSESTHSEELFDVNVLNNIKKERVTDDERQCMEQFSPRRQKGKHREIINVKELQDDFSSTVMTVQVKQEAIEETKTDSAEILKPETETEKRKEDKEEKKEDSVEWKPEPKPVPPVGPTLPFDPPPPRPPVPANDRPVPPPVVVTQNKEYIYNEVVESDSFGMHTQELVISPESAGYPKAEDSYEMYEQMAMAYQSDVASKQTCPEETTGSQRIETVVRVRTLSNTSASLGRGEIKCDWRAADGQDIKPVERPSRWGLKPGEVNIVLTGGTEPYASPAPVYQIQSIANRTDTAGSGYDEAYMDMYGAADRLQYGDCFSSPIPPPLTPGGPRPTPRGPKGVKPLPEEGPKKHSGDPRGQRSSLDDRITRVLKETVLGEVAREEDKDGPERGILVTKSLSVEAGRNAKRVSFADGYKPGQDSDTEHPPKKRPRRVGCPWPCPLTHPDHVPLWDALPPPPPPPGDPPAFTHARGRYDPTAPMQNFMPPEPPPGILTF